MKIVLLLSAALVCWSCNNGQGGSDAKNSGSVHTGAHDTLVTTAKPLALEGCYAMIMGRDTATLQLHVRDTAVTGTLVYDWHEKDRNTGRLEGVVRQRHILADYTFESEGLTSVRQVVFLIGDSSLLPGTGEMTQQANKMVFAEPSRLRFDAEPPFTPVPCATSEQ